MAWYVHTSILCTDGAAQQLHNLYLTRDYFTLAEQVKTLDNHDPQRLFFDGQLDAAFLNDDLAIDKLRRFIQMPSMNAKWRREALTTLSETHLRRGEYRIAFEEFSLLLSKFGPELSTEERAGINQEESIARALQNLPSQSRIDTSISSSVAASKDKSGHIFMDVSVNGSSEQMIMDTGANFNVASEAFAHRHKIHILPNSVQIKTFAGEAVSALLGIANKVEIGNVILRHVAFIIVPDKDVPHSTDSSMDGVIGFQILRSLERWQVTSGGDCVEISRSSKNLLRDDFSITPNIACDGFLTLVKLRSSGIIMTFMLDTGSDLTMIFPRFSDRLPQVLHKAVPRISRTLTIGSKSADYTRALPQLELSINGRLLKAHNVVVGSRSLPFLQGSFGLLGADTLAVGYEVDFKQMTITPNYFTMPTR